MRTACALLLFVAACTTPATQDHPDAILFRLASRDPATRDRAITALKSLPVMEAHAILASGLQSSLPEIAEACAELLAPSADEAMAWYERSGLLALDAQLEAYNQVPFYCGNWRVSVLDPLRNLGAHRASCVTTRAADNRRCCESPGLRTLTLRVDPEIEAAVARAIETIVIREDAPATEFVRAIARQAGTDAEMEGSRLHFTTRERGIRWVYEAGILLRR